MWWFAAVHALVEGALRRRPGREELPLLDAGCGTGGLLHALEARMAPRPMVGIDVSPAAISRARRKSRTPLAIASVSALPFSEQAFGAVVSIDVLCHREVPPARALEEFHRILAPGGTLVLNLPAYRWLYSAHDIRVHNARRFERSEIRAMLSTSGFVEVDVGHWNTLPFPLMVLQRLVLARRRDADAESDVMEFSPMIDRMLRVLMSGERRMRDAGMRMPFGGSLLAVAARPR